MINLEKLKLNILQFNSSYDVTNIKQFEDSNYLIINENKIKKILDNNNKEKENYIFVVDSNLNINHAIDSIGFIEAKLKKQYLDIADDAKEHAEHIGDNSGKIGHQREHFVMLSKDINDLIKLFGTKQKLYQDYCPMADEGKGAIWISEVKEIKNPYYGSNMLTCGSIKKTL